MKLSVCSLPHPGLLVGVLASLLAAPAASLAAPASDDLDRADVAPAPQAPAARKADRDAEEPEARDEPEAVAPTQEQDRRVPLDLRLRDDAGKPVRLGELVHGDRPMILTLTYADSPGLLDLQLDGFVEAVRPLDESIGEQFDVISVRMVSRVVPKKAREQTLRAAAIKQKYLARYGREGAHEGWHFLTGWKPQMKILAEAVGLPGVGEGSGAPDAASAHAATFLVVSANARVTRRLDGFAYVPETIHRALVEASGGQIGDFLDQVALFCFRYDPAKGYYAPVIWRVLLLLGAVLALLLGLVVGEGWARRIRGASKRRLPRGWVPRLLAYVDDKLGRSERAYAKWLAVVERDPENLDAWKALLDLYGDHAMWEECAHAARRIIALADASEANRVRLVLAKVVGQELGNREESIRLVREVRVLGPPPPKDLDGLAELLCSLGAWDEAVGTMEQAAALDPDAEAKCIRNWSIVNVFRNQLDKPDGARDALERILVHRPEDEEAFTLLAQIYRRAGEWRRLVTVSERFVPLASDERQRQILGEIRDVLADKLDDKEQALAAAYRAYEQDPTDVDAARALERIAVDANDAQRLVEVLQAALDGITDAAVRTTLLRRIAGICARHLHDVPTAVATLEKLLTLDPDDTQAVDELAAIATHEQRPDLHIAVLERKLRHVGDDAQRKAILTEIARLWEDPCQQTDKAIDALRRILQIDDCDQTALRALERIYRKESHWAELVDVLQRQVPLARGSEERASLSLSVAGLYETHLQNLQTAADWYRVALDLRPGHVGALASLERLCAKLERWSDLVDILQAQIDATDETEEKLWLLARVASLQESKLNSPRDAVVTHERALDLDPTHLATVESLERQLETLGEGESDRLFELFQLHASLLYDANEIATFWKDAALRFEELVMPIDKSCGAADVCKKHYRVGYLKEKDGAMTAALSHYRQAFEADPTSLPLLEGLSRALLGCEEWDEARNILETILLHHRELLAHAEVADVECKLGELCLNRGELDRAHVHFDNAAQADPQDPRPLRTLVALEQRAGAYERAYECLGKLADLSPSRERVQVLIEMSEVAHFQLHDVGRVIAPLERARRLDSLPLDLSRRLADAYVTAKNAPKAVEVLEEAVGATSEPQAVSDLSLRLGSLYENEIGDESLAVHKYRNALEAVPMSTQALRALERILANRHQWTELEAIYRSMLAPDKDLSMQARTIVWRSLAGLYRGPLGQTDNAITAYEIVRKLEPGRPQDAAVLSDLYWQQPALRPKAIELGHEWLRTDDDPVPAMRRLHALYRGMGDFDAAYVLCSTLLFLGEADPEERHLVEHLSPGVPRRAHRGFMEEQWQWLFEPELGTPVGRLCAALHWHALDFITVPAKELGLKKRDLVEVRNSELYLASLVRYVAELVGRPPMDVYRQDGARTTLQICNARPPALAWVNGGEALDDAAQRILSFHIGRNLAYARPELYLPRAFPGEALRDVLLGLCTVYDPTLRHSLDRCGVEYWARVLAQVPGRVLKRLQGPAREAYGDLLKAEPLHAYAAAVEKTAAKVGLLAAGDLSVSAQALHEGGDGAWPLPVRERMAALVSFCVSPEHLKLRRITGAAFTQGSFSAAPAMPLQRIAVARG